MDMVAEIDGFRWLWVQYLVVMVDSNSATETAKNDNLELSGRFVVAVGDAVVTEISEGDGEREWRVTYDSPKLYGVESVEVTHDDMQVFVDVMHMIQRSCNNEEYVSFPTPLEDVYDAVVYTNMMLHAESGREAYQEDVTAMEDSSRYEIDAPEWVEQAL